MDIFSNLSASPMLIAEIREPFDSSDFLYELKLDGERCLAYLDQKETVLQNKKKLILNTRYPELTKIHELVSDKCILDGELAVLVDGKPKFSEVQRRSLLTNRFKIQLAADQYPACFTAFDILYWKDRPVVDLPLTKRKELLQQAVKTENSRFALSRIVEGKGVAFYNLAAQQGLEGIVAKRKGSLYYMGKRTKDWIKFKNLQDDDYVVLGYIPKENHVASIILGQYRGDQIVEKGHVTLGVAGDDFQEIRKMPKTEAPFSAQKDLHSAVWIKPGLVCTVKYMEKTAGGGLRQPVFKGLRDDKEPKECIES